MRAGIPIVILLAACYAVACHHMYARNLSGGNAAPLAFARTATKPDFENQLKPIFEARCQPCHFQGGKVYDKMPFDKPETIRRLGEKLFTRIKDEKERRLIREFLSPQ